MKEHISAEFEPFLKNVSQDAGTLAYSYWKKQNDLKYRRKGEKFDVVTEADIAVEKFIRARIHKTYPDHAILGEEGGLQSKNSPFCWIIDPIDGTVSFMHGQFHWGVSIALQYDGTTLLGALNCPAYNLSFFAKKDEGATMNGTVVCPSQTDELGNACVCTGFCCIRAGWKENNLPVFNEAAQNVQGIRRLGSIATDICFVACGKLDACWEMNVNLYDVAAALLIAEEAGASVTDLSGGTNHLPEFPLVTNGKLHADMLRIVSKHHIPYELRS
jgi:myo-inositol-1(or 4)-monophosphatase